MHLWCSGQVCLVTAIAVTPSTVPGKDGHSKRERELLQTCAARVLAETEAPSAGFALEAGMSFPAPASRTSVE